MTLSRSFVLFSGAMLGMVAVVPAQAIAQDSETAGASGASIGPPGPAVTEPGVGPKITPIAFRYGMGGGLGSCDTEGSFFGPHRSFPIATRYRDQLSCMLRDTRISQDGDYGGGGGRPNPASPTSYSYPDTRFDLAAVLDDYRVSGGARKVSGQPSSGGVAAQPVYREPLEPQFEGPAMGKKAAAYAARRGATDRKTIPEVMEPLEPNSWRSRDMRVTRLPVRTKPVVTRQIMEQRIREGEMRRAERSNPGSQHDASERSERPPTPRSSVQRAGRSRPAASRPQSSRSAGASSAPSASSAPARSPRSSRGSSTAEP